MPTLYITDPDFLAHDTGPGHPERPDRLRAIARVTDHELFDALVRESADEADEATLALGHPESYIEKVKQARPTEGVVHLDGDTVMSPGSWTAALKAVGAGMKAVDKVMSGAFPNAFCAVRPCGHHAEHDRAMGFCLFSNIALASHYARKAHGVERVAVVDFDVHHGNGTQDIFWSEPNLFLGSSHQMPLFPGTGAASERGVGNIVNVPLRPGDGSEPFRAAYDEIILPALSEFAPDLVMISAGFDAHRDDPLANLELVEEDFAWVTRRILEVADARAGGRVVSMLEGGYNLDALAKSVAVHLKVLMDASG